MNKVEDSTMKANKERLSVAGNNSIELPPLDTKEGIRTSQFSENASQSSIKNLHNYDRMFAHMPPAAGMVSRLLLTSQNTTPSNKGLMIRNTIAPR